MKRIFYFLRSFIKLETVAEAQNLNLKHDTNVFGDSINHLNCRSLWYDKFGNMYKCDELLEGGRSEQMEEVKKQFPTLF